MDLEITMTEEYSDLILVSQPEDLQKLQHRSKNISIDSLDITELKLGDSLESYGADKVVEFLSLNIEKLCSGRNWTKSTRELKTLYLPKLKYLDVRESVRCDYLVWIFRWDMPEIEIIRFEHLTLYSNIEREFQKFISKHASSVRKVMFVNIKGKVDPWMQFILSKTKAEVRIEGNA